MLTICFKDSETKSSRNWLKEYFDKSCDNVTKNKIFFELFKLLEKLDQKFVIILDAIDV
jgi:predicted nucleotide-binding protein (sugar kinase/HSP70/actin superfamily)